MQNMPTTENELIALILSNPLFKQVPASPRDRSATHRFRYMGATDEVYYVSYASGYVRKVVKYAQYSYPYPSGYMTPITEYMDLDVISRLQRIARRAIKLMPKG